MDGTEKYIVIEKLAVHYPQYYWRETSCVGYEKAMSIMESRSTILNDDLNHGKIEDYEVELVMS